MRQARSRRRCQAFPAHPCERHCGHCCRRRTCEDDIANGQTVSIDPLNLLVVDAGANRSKGDRDTSTWLQPFEPFRCTYVARQIAVKGKYDLWLTAAERDAMTRVVATCPTMALPGPGSASTVATSPSNQPNRAPSIQPAPAPAPPASGVSYRNLLRLVRRCCPDYSRATRLLTQARPRRRRYRLRMTQDWQNTAP